jgi:hypothetical protein
MTENLCKISYRPFLLYHCPFIWEYLGPIYVGLLKPSLAFYIYAENITETRDGSLSWEVLLNCIGVATSLIGFGDNNDNHNDLAC